MRRREFFSVIGGAAAGWPLAAQAQSSGKLPTVGFLGASAASTQAQWTAAFVKRLNELGWIEGRTIAIEYRFAGGRNERFAELAAELVRLNVDVILTDGGATLAAKKETSTIPIVFAVAADPVGGGYVSSLSRPGGNVTGSSVQASDTATKRLGLLREAIPGLRRLAILVNLNYAAAVRETGEVENAARDVQVETVRGEVRRVEDIAPAIEGLKGRAEGLYVCTDSFFNSNRGLINSTALTAGLPTMHGIRATAEGGGMMSYSANFPALFRRAAEKVDKILRGAAPGDLPVEQPTQFDLMVNLKTAAALGLTLPPTLIGLANEVVE
jgi:putative tryptophan/tyrosine transport system substrate-binding protein